MTSEKENIDKSVSDQLESLISRIKDETKALKNLHESLFKKIESEKEKKSTKTNNEKK